MRNGFLCRILVNLSIWAAWMSGFAMSGCAHQVGFHCRQVKAMSQPFDGVGHFKFSLVSNDGAVTFWSNDGVTLNGTEPTTDIETTVTQGIYSVNLGDASIPNMAPLDARLFDSVDRLKLRVWFSDGVRGFERLLPDREVTNPALVGTINLSESHLYVNASTGNDLYSGLTPGKPKKTIQAAWNALPPLILRNVTIHIAPGTYREEVLMTGKFIAAKGGIVIVGNKENPDSVIVSGADESAPATPVRMYNFRLLIQKGVMIKGIYFKYTDGVDWIRYIMGGGILLESGSACQISKCKFIGHARAMTVTTQSEARIDNCEVGQGSVFSSRGVSSSRNSSAFITRCNFHDLYRAVEAMDVSYAQIGETIVSNITHEACCAGFASSLAFIEPASTFKNCSFGLYATANGTIRHSQSRVNMINCPAPRRADTGGLYIDY